MFPEEKSRARRSLVRESRLNSQKIWETIRTPQIVYSILIAAAFWLGLSGLIQMRAQMVRIRPDKIAPYDISSRVAFSITNPERVAELKREAMESAPRVFRADAECFKTLEQNLRSMPEDVAAKPADQLPPDLALALDIGAITQLKQIASEPAELDNYRKWAVSYVEQLKKARDSGSLTVLDSEERAKISPAPGTTLKILSGHLESALDPKRTFTKVANQRPTDVQQRDELLKIIAPLASQNFQAPLSANIASYTVNQIPVTHKYDLAAHEQEQRLAEQRADLSSATQPYTELSKLLERNKPVTPERWAVLRKNRPNTSTISNPASRSNGTFRSSARWDWPMLLTAGLSAYIAAFQPRIVRNKFRAVAIAALLLGSQLACQMAGQSNLPLEFFAAAPALLTAMILTIAYDQRLAMGISLLHGLMITMGLGQPGGFFLILLAGILTVVFMLDDVRKRSKLVIVGRRVGQRDGADVPGAERHRSSEPGRDFQRFHLFPGLPAWRRGSRCSAFCRLLKKRSGSPQA